MKVRLLTLTAAAAGLALTAAPALSAAPAADPAVAAVAVAPEGSEPVPVPTVEGPIPVTQDSHPFLSTDVVDAYGYVEEEFFVSGVAPDETFRVDSPYKTRLLVRRPADPARSSGTTVLEWYNVTGGYDQEYEWFTSHEHFMRSGITWVGVSNQYIGVNELRNKMPERYGSLRFAGDGASDGVYSQAAMALLAPTGVDPLAGARPERLLAGGHSQSGTKLAQYYNDEQPQQGLFDGFMLRGIEERVDEDRVRVPVLRVQTETDFTEGSNSSDVDSEFYRRWDVSGSSHVDKDQVTYKDPLVLRDRGSLTPVACLEEPYSRIPFRYALNAGYDAMVRWLTDGTPPPMSPRFEHTLDVIRRDQHGNALGGIRLPEHEAATATNTGDNQGAGFCILYGSHAPFDAETLQARYGTHEAYVAQVEQVAAQRVAEGFMVQADADRAVAAARVAELGLPRAQPGTTPPVSAPAGSTPPDARSPRGGAATSSTSAGSTSAAQGGSIGSSRALAATGGPAVLPLLGAGVLLATAVARRGRRSPATDA